MSFDYEGYSYKKGVTTHMNGDKALEYCRMRYDDPEGDYGRQKRQRQVLTAIIKSGADVQSLLKPAFLNSVSSQVRTDLTFSDLTQMAKSYRASGDQLETPTTPTGPALTRTGFPTSTSVWQSGKESATWSARLLT